jgi:hypothetical protein
LGGENFIEVEEGIVVGGVVVGSGGAVIVEPEVDAMEFGEFFVEERRGELFVKPVGIAGAEAAFVPVSEGFEEFGIAVDMAFEIGGIEDEPFFDIGDD